MKRLKVISILFLMKGLLHAQNPVSDSISMGGGYANMAYYSFGTGAKASAPATGWDLQIWTSLMSASIRTNDNSATSAQLYELQNHDTSAWASVDTTGMTPIYNADTSWDVSAFNANQTGHPNYGWGIYQGAGNLSGVKIFVIKTVNGNYKKIWVKRLVAGDEYQFLIADLDGSNETAFSLTKTNYSTKSFFYYSIDSAKVIDSEPAKTDWDVVFRRYWAVDTAYVVAGALSHPSVHVAEARGLDVASNDYTSLIFDANTSVIGYDWKSFDMNTFQWQLADSLAYFVYAQDGYIYKVVFTGFGGSGTGKVVFSKTQLSPPATALSELSNMKALTVYPNPVEDQLQAIFSVEQAADVTLSIFDLSGKSHLTEKAQVHSGLNVLNLNTEALSQGFYLLSVDDGNNRLTYKFVR